tara:strand:+ start:8178 stop:13562 length:5385 start_codon:yes stop_codon:yes gene_type:complete
MANRFDKPHILTTKIDSNKVANLFSVASNMDTFEIKNISLRDKIPLSIQDNNGNNLIHIAILDNGNNSELVRLEFIKFLYNENVNPDAPNRENITPLLYACERQYASIVEYLIEIGVDINYADNFNNNAYHYLFGSMIKNYNPIIQKSLFPRYKEIDTKKIEFIKSIKKQIFNKVLKQGDNIAPELTSILQTIENSIGTSVEAKNIVLEFQNEYNKLINDTKTKETFSVNNLFGVMLNKFIRLIQKKWNQFPKSGNIDLHTITENSYPLNDESGLSVIKNNDYKVYIKEECDKIISNLTSNTLENNNIVSLIDLDEVNKRLLTQFVRKIGRNLTMTSLGRHEDEYNDMNKFIHSNCIDNADNIIDYENNTFAGGSRQVEIIDEFNDINLIRRLFGKSKEEEIVGALAYSLLYDYEAPAAPAAPAAAAPATPATPATPYSFNFVYNFPNNSFILSGNTLENTIVEYIYSIAMDDNIFDSEDALITELKDVANDNYKYLLQLIEKRKNFNRGHYLYVFCCAYKGIDRIKNGANNSNLKIELRQGIVLLCSAVYHNSGDILKSLYNVFKPLLIKSKINTGEVNTSYSNVIELLLYDNNITNNINNIITTDDKYKKLKRIKLLTNEYFQNNPINFDDNDKQYLNLNDKDIKGMIDSEKLGFYIVHYYSEMEHKPLLQNIVDILVLIRLFDINKNRNSDNKLNNFIDRLKSLYLQPTKFAKIKNIQDDSNMEHTKLNDTDIDSYFRSLFNTNDLRKIYEQISQYQIPSRINYFLYGDYEYLNETIDNTALTEDMKERKLFLLKQIEANHFGLNFIGLIPSLTNIPDIPNPAGVIWNTDLNLFNYNRTNNGIQDTYYFHPLSANDYLNRPPTYLAYFNLLQTFSNNVNELQNRILSRLREMFNKLKGGNTELYSKAIGYYYPILNALESQEKFFHKVQNNTSRLITSDNLPYNTAQQLRPYFPKNTFNIDEFNREVNRLNGLLFLYYYLNRTGKMVRIPKFLYHQLGTKPLVIFDNPNKNIIYPGNETNTQQKLRNNTKKTNSRRLKNQFTGNYHSYNSGNDFDNIIENIQNRRFFISRDIIAADFITSKNSKLPPSLESVFNDFLKYTINGLARKAVDAIDATKIEITDKNIDKIQNLRNDMVNIQNKLLVAKYTEELVIEYLKNNVYRIGYTLFTGLIRKSDEITDSVEQYFGELDFNVLLDKEPTRNEIREIDQREKDIIKNYYNFSDKNMDKIIENVKQQYKLYPNNYNSIRVNKKFFRVEIKEEIVKLLLNNNCNLFTSNNEGQLSIINLLKHFKFDILNIKDENENNLIDFQTFNTSNNLSPQKFIYNEYIMNLEKFISRPEYDFQLADFTQNQYNDVYNNIIGNEKLGFNIINNLKVSFAICNYITQQFLSEKMYDFNNSFKYDDLDNILTLINKGKIDFKNVYLNKILGTLKIPESNNDIVIDNIKKNLENKIKKLEEEEKIFKLKTKEMNNLSESLPIQNIAYLNKISLYNYNVEKLENIKSKNLLKTKYMDEVELNIIKRYKNLINKLRERLVFMEGFKKMFNTKVKLNNSDENIIQHLLNNSDENIIQHLLNYEYSIHNDNNKDLKNNDLITKLSKFYSHLSGYCEVYFHNEYICHNGETVNPIKEFVRELLVFLTQNVICVGIETLVRKVLFEYFSLTRYSDMNLNAKQVDFILDKSNFNINNYEILAKKLVLNNTNVFNDEFEENEIISESVNDLINNMLDTLIKTSPLKLDDKVKEQLKNITPYFETIVPKTINNWRVVIENQFLYVINHARILKCINIVGLPPSK